MTYDYRLARIDKAAEAYLEAMNIVSTVLQRLSAARTYEDDQPLQESYIYEHYDHMARAHSLMVVYGNVNAVKLVDSITDTGVDLIFELLSMKERKELYKDDLDDRDYRAQRQDSLAQVIKDFTQYRKLRSDFMWEAHQQIANAVPQQGGEPWKTTENKDG